MASAVIMALLPTVAATYFASPGFLWFYPILPVGKGYKPLYTIMALINCSELRDEPFPEPRITLPSKAICSPSPFTLIVLTHCSKHSSKLSAFTPRMIRQIE
jgi:hypothetical protein